MSEDEDVCSSCGGCGQLERPRRQSVKMALRVVNTPDRVARAKSVSPEQLVQNIRANGAQYGVKTLRSSIIGGLEIRSKRGQAENMIHIGCACFGTALPLRAYCLILQKLGIGYAFLDKEYCCGSPLISRAIHEQRDTGPAEEASKEFLGLNISQVRTAGLKNIVYFCQWCAYLGKRFYADSDINQVYAPDLLVHSLPSLKLDAKIAYFGNTPHRRPVYVPEQNFDLGWPEYKRLLHQIDGLDVIDIPSYCCQLIPEVIFERTVKAGADTLVTTCMACYGNLSRKARKFAPQIRVKHFYSLLLAALEGDPRVLDWF